MTAELAQSLKRSWVSRTSTSTFNVVTVSFGVFLSLVPVSYHHLAGSVGAPFFLSIIGIFAFGTASVLLIWRNTLAVPITIGASIAAILLPGTPFPALVALVTVFKQRSWSTVAWLSGLVMVATVAAGLWDFSLGADSVAAAFAPEDSRPSATELFDQAGWILPLGTVIWMWPAVTWGLIARTLTDRNRARSDKQKAEHAAQELRDAADTQAARQAIARELHDTIAAKLSTVSLHAGALEAQAAQNPELLDSARVVRAAVQDSIEDLRHVVAQLRDPDPTVAAQLHSYSADDLEELLDEAHRLGSQVRSRISLSDFTLCDPGIRHACYRIVQESLTNARKHAPAAPLSVTVQGNAVDGVFIKVHTEGDAGAGSSEGIAVAEGGASTRPSGGHGLIGMRERAQQLGGSLSAQFSPEGGFCVDGWLPPRPAALEDPSAVL